MKYKRVTDEHLAEMEHRELNCSAHDFPNESVLSLIEEVREARKAKAKKIGHFDICREMALRGLDIRLSTVDNISSMEIGGRGKKNRHTRVTIGIVGDVLNPIARGQLIGGLLLCDKEQYHTLRKELEEQLAKG